MRVNRKVKVSLVSVGLVLLILWFISLIVTGIGNCSYQYSDSNIPIWCWIPWFPLAALAGIALAVGLCIGIVVLPIKFTKWIWELASEIVDDWDRNSNGMDK